MNYKLLAVDEDGNNCYVDLRELIKHVAKRIEKEHTKFSTEDPNHWMANEGLYFKHRVRIDTNVGIFSKVNDSPAIIAFAKFYDSEGIVNGRLIFASKDRKGCIYLSPDGKQHPNPKEHNGWFYNVIKEDVRLAANAPVKQFSNLIFGSEEDALENLISSAGIVNARYFTVFPSEGDILMAMGSNYPDDVMNAPIIFDTEGNIWCNQVFDRSGKAVGK